MWIQMLLCNWMTDSFFTHIVCTHGWKFQLEVVGYLRSLYVVSMGLFCLARMVCFVCLIWIKKNQKRTLEFCACANILNHSDCFVRHAWCALSVLFCDGKFLPKAVFILSLFQFCLSIETAAVCPNILELVWLGTHGVHFLFYFMLKNSLSLSKFSCNLIADWFVRHAQLCLFCD